MSQATEGGIAQGQALLLTTDEHSYAFDLWEHFRISLGRHQSNDVPLVSRKVSNYHAEILNEGDRAYCCWPSLKKPPSSSSSSTVSLPKP